MKPSIRSLLLVTTGLFVFAAAAGAVEGGIIESPAYKECIALSNSNPAQALAKADEWLTIDNGIAAHHCRAMALYGLHRYEEAGDALTMLRQIVPEQNLSLRYFVTRQAVTAWKNANRTDAALTVLDAQIKELGQARGNNAANAKLTSALLVERAKINIVYGKTSAATADLDHAISLTPLNTDALLTRAEAFEQLGDHGLAKADVEAALTLKPDDSRARELLAKIDVATMPAPLPVAH